MSRPSALVRPCRSFFVRAGSRIPEDLGDHPRDLVGGETAVGIEVRRSALLVGAGNRHTTRGDAAVAAGTRSAAADDCGDLGQLADACPVVVIAIAETGIALHAGRAG